MLDRTHMFHDAYSRGVLEGITATTCDAHDVFVLAGLHTVLEMFNAWRAGDLRALCGGHGVRVMSRDTAPGLYEKLLLHECSLRCSGSVFCFRRLAHPRTAAHVSKSRDRLRGALFVGEASYMSVASEELKRSIISEWQDVMHTHNVRLTVCAVCSRRVARVDSHLVNARTVDLSLLRNDHLPEHVMPSTYSLEEYDGALLDPKGMVDVEECSDIMMCGECHSDVSNAGKMPKFALANWLYYGRDELPADVREAFDRSTWCERVLVSRARASRVSFRFSEIKGHYLFGTNPAIAQGCVRGNV